MTDAKTAAPDPDVAAAWLLLAERGLVGINFKGLLPDPWVNVDSMMLALMTARPTRSSGPEAG